MNFPRDGLLYKSSSKVMNEMQKAEQLTSTLNGLTIRWSGIGQTTEPQITLPTKELENLKTIYYDILTAKGAKKVVFYDNALSGKTLDNKYKVTPTPIEDVISFSNKELEFIGNSDQFKDEPAAKATLSQVLQKAKAKPTKKIVITGYMAAGQCDLNVDDSLALKRAEAVKRILENDIPESRMQAVNGGVPKGDECADGVWQNELAEHKRKVIVEFQ